MSAEMSTVRLVQFRVYAGEQDGRGLFVYARVFATKREMLRACRVERKASGQKGGYHPETAGVMQSFERWHGGRRTPCFGRVNLFKGRLGVEVVTHEFAHAMFAWAWRRNLIAGLAGMPVEEQCCYVLGRMVRRFVARAYKLGLYAE